MKPIVLVLLVAASAYAAPSISSEYVGVNVVPIENTRQYDSGKSINGGLTDSLLTLVDNGDVNVFTIMLKPVIEDLSNVNDSRSKALAVAQILAVLQQLAYGIPGDSCAAANAITASVNGGTARQYVSSLASAIDALALLVQNPLALRFRSAPTGGCQGGGRNYNFEAAWDKILRNANPYNVGLLNEEYCTGKRLATSNSVQSNNVGAALTAASLPAVISAVDRAILPIVNFLRGAIYGGNVNQLASQAKHALLA